MFKDKKQSYCTWVLQFGTFHWRFFKTTWNNHIQGFVEQMALYLSLSISTIYISPTNSGVGRISLTFLACLLTGFSVQARSQSSFPCEQGCLRLFCAQSKVRGLVLRANHSEEPVCLQSHSLENWSRITCSYHWCCSHTLLFSIGGFILIQCSSFPIKRLWVSIYSSIIHSIFAIITAPKCGNTIQKNIKAAYQRVYHC